MDEGKPSIYEDRKSGEIAEQINFRVEVDGQEKEWTVTKARTINSLYGQIALLGRYHGGLTDKTITLLVKFDRQNNKREYTVQGALPLIDEWNKQQEEKETEQQPVNPFQYKAEL